MTTVLVTGCAGYIGSVLTGNLLAAGYKVVGVDKLFYGNGGAVAGFLGNKNFEFYNLDIVDNPLFDTVITRLVQPKVIFHLAAMVGAPRCDKNKDYAKAVNQYATEHLVSLLDDSQRLIFPNTNSGYGIGGADFCTEESPLNPISLYGETKCAAEKAVLSRENSVSLRLATVFGSSWRPRFDLLVNDWTAQLYLFRKLEIYEPHFRRNYVHVQDVTRCMMFMMDPEFEGIYNVGLDSANMTKMELANTICDTLAIQRDGIKQGKGEDKDKRNYIVSNDKLLKTGFHFKHPIEDGILEVARLTQMMGYKVLKMGNNSYDYSQSSS